MRQTMIDISGLAGGPQFHLGVLERPFGGPLPAAAQTAREDLLEARDRRVRRALRSGQDDIGRGNRFPS